LRVYAWLAHGPFLLDGACDGFGERFGASLHRQVGHLTRVVERDVGGNHLIKNLKALIAAGHEEALEELEREVSRQILPDGGHYERSPSYHLQVLCDLMDIRELLACPPWLDGAIGRMGAALAVLRHGDGKLALFNDGDEGNPALLAAVDRLAVAPASVLDDCGYYRLESGDSVVIMDAGRCCPDDLPAHAHADTLAFEMSVGGNRLVVNCGTYAYQDAAWRNRLRGTAAHSTVTIDGLDSAEVYGAFRLGRRPRKVTAVRHGAES